MTSLSPRGGWIKQTLRRSCSSLAVNNILDEIVRQTRHMVLRQRVLNVVDDLARTCSDPLISATCSCINTVDQSIIDVAITSQGYETVRW